MKQMRLATGGLERFSKETRRAAFLADMAPVVLCAGLCTAIEPYYPNEGR